MNELITAAMIRLKSKSIYTIATRPFIHKFGKSAMNGMLNKELMIVGIVECKVNFIPHVCIF